jgi:hypothetical protein
MILPTNPQRVRSIMIAMLFGAGVVCTGIAIGAVLIAWLGTWPEGLAGDRLSIVGKAALGGMAGMGMVIVALAIGGPVGRVKGKVGTIFELDAEGDK